MPDTGLTVNSPVCGSKPTWTVCSKFDGGDMIGRSFSFFVFPPRKPVCTIPG